ncbi:MAG: hypothetical protein M3068_08980 [Gemmatimonadota bacterium]|nr:hypothetical protein [Gemmatimonadota bacterium]
MPRSPNAIRLALAGSMALLACLAVLVVTEPPEPGLDPDAISYLSGAESIVRDHRVFVMTDGWRSADSVHSLQHFPPGFPAAIAIPRSLGMPPVQAARLIVALSALVGVFTLSWLMATVSGSMGALLLPLMLIVTPAVAFIYQSVLSEPLFLALVSLTLLCLVRIPSQPLLAGLLASCVALTRYSGVGVPAAVVLWMLVDGAPTRQDRLRNAVKSALPPLIAIGWWTIRNARRSGPGSLLWFHGGEHLDESLREGARNIGGWLAPSLDGAWVPITAAAVTVLVILLARATAPRLAPDRWRDLATWRPELRLIAASMLLAAVYAGVVALSRILVYSSIPFDDRMLAPLELLLEIPVAVALVAWWRGARWRARAPAAVVVAAWLAASGWSTADAVSYALEDGLDYAHARWRTSELVEWVRANGDAHPLFSNYPAALYFHAGRMARLLPQHVELDTVRAFADTLAQRHGLIISFDYDSSVWVVSPKPLLSALPIRRVTRVKDGEVWEPVAR